MGGKSSKMLMARCEFCLNDPPLPADRYCTDCSYSICDECVESHRETPATENHNYVSSKSALAVQKDINNKNKDKDGEPERGEKILSLTDIEKIRDRVYSKNNRKQVRSVEHNFRDVSKRIKLVNTTEKLPGAPGRLGVVNGNIWVTSNLKEKDPAEVTVYNEHLIKVKQHSWHQV